MFQDDDGVKSHRYLTRKQAGEVIGLFDSGKLTFSDDEVDRLTVPPDHEALRKAEEEDL